MLRASLASLALMLSLSSYAAAVPAPAGVPPSVNLWRSPDAFNPAGAPFEMAAVEPSSTASTGVGSDGLSIRYAIMNTSKETLTRIGVLVLSFFPSGQLAGYHTFNMKTRVAPGERTYGTYATARYHVAASDRLVMVPYSAAGSALRWTMSADDLAAVGRTLTSARGEASAAGEVNLQDVVGPPHNQYPGDPGSSGGCLTTCQSANSQCEAICKCGIASTGCTCNPDGTLTTSCSCFMCPPPK